MTPWYFLLGCDKIVQSLNDGDMSWIFRQWCPEAPCFPAMWAATRCSVPRAAGVSGPGEMGTVTAEEMKGGGEGRPSNDLEAAIWDHQFHGHMLTEVLGMALPS